MFHVSSTDEDNVYSNRSDLDILYPYEISSLSDAQEIILALLPIIPSILSIFGSASILRILLQDGKHSPYRRMLFAMSCCDILSSLTLACQVWLVPRETSQTIWALGNDVTCTTLGTLMKLSFANILYAGMLSHYFLLIIRYRWREERFARKVEPFMHFICLSYPLVTAVAGAAIGVYLEMELGPGCWVTNYPSNCGTQLGESGQICLSTFYGYIFGALPIFFVILSLTVNHISIYMFVRKIASRTMDSSLRGSEASRQQIREVATQSFLYVAAFTLCYIWTVILRVLEAAPFNFGPSEQDDIFVLLCLQSIFLPLQGFLNLGVFLRPRMNVVRESFSHESWCWVARRALSGDVIRPTKHSHHSDDHSQMANEHTVSPPTDEDTTFQRNEGTTSGAATNDALESKSTLHQEEQ